MSTRALFTFQDPDGSEYHVYKHYNGYPLGAINAIEAALKLKKVWDLPRYEADEFAAGFIAANKTGPGALRLTVGKNWEQAISSDCEYHYTVSLKSGKLHVVADAVECWDFPYKSTRLKSGTLSAVSKWAIRENAAA